MKAIKIQLDNLYVQIKLHHERGEYEKAASLFKEVNFLNKKIIQGEKNEN